MSKHYHTGFRLHASSLDDEELPMPVWAWLLVAVMLLLVLVVR